MKPAFRILYTDELFHGRKKPNFEFDTHKIDMIDERFE